MSARGAVAYLKSTSTFKLPRDQLEELQVRKLQALIRFAYDNNKVSRENIKRSGLNPGDGVGLRELRKIQPVSKAEMMTVQDAAREAGLLEGTRVVMSTGTTGQPSGFARGGARGSSSRVISIRTNMLHGLRPWTRVATLWAPQRYWKLEVQEDGTSKPYTGLYRNPLWPFRRVLKNLLTLWVNPMDPVGDGRTLSKFNPEIIYGRPSYLRRIARYCGSDLKVRPRLIEAAGEIMTETSFKELRNAYGSKVVRQYGSSDVGKLGADCLFENGIHLWEDYRIYEVLKDGEQVSPGEVGELVVTNLWRDSIPFIRFRTGDYVRLGDADKCGCGTYMRRLRSIEGRENDCIIGRDGRKTLALEVAEPLESRFGLRDFQLIQNQTLAFSLLLRPDDLEAHGDPADIKHYLEELVGSPVSLDVKPRSDDDYWVKTRPVVSRIG